MNCYVVTTLVVLVVHASLCLSSRTPNSRGHGSHFQVKKYGAIGDGLHDDTQAFAKAWSAACGATRAKNGIATIVVPRGQTFLISPITFSGPCKPNIIQFQVQGKIVAPSKLNGWNNCYNNGWLVFEHINNLVVFGAGVIDGRGSSWWSNVGQANGDSTCYRPTALRFNNCRGLALRGITSLNSPGSHISITRCDNSLVSNIHLTAPEDSPNTDGIDLTSSTQVRIQDSTIATGDDCISIGSDTSFINVTGINCGPGHGISIGSLGKDGAFAKVEHVYVKHCSFRGTENGARIKTWQGGKGYARDITFEDIPLINVQRPIIIDQFYYCNEQHNCQIQGSAVAISGVTYRGFHGTSATKEAIKLNCSSTVGCTDISMEDIDIRSPEGASATCNNVRGRQSSVTPKVPCLN